MKHSSDSFIYTPRLKTSKTYFPGAKTFFCYNEDNKPEFLYANKDITKEGSNAKGLLWLILFVPLAILIGGILLLQLQEGSGDGEEAQRDQ